MQHYSNYGAQNPGFLAESAIHHHRSAKAFQNKDGSELRIGRDYALDSYDDLEALMPVAGIGFRRGTLNRLYECAMDMSSDFAMDSIQQPVTSPNIATPIQFLQNWLPGVVKIVTAARKIDEIVGKTTIGSWEDEQIVQQVVEMTGAAVPYSDLGNVPLANWNPTFVTRTVVRFELGLRVGNLEQDRAARMRIDSGGQKRESDALQLEIQRNAVGFYGYNDGLGLTYGFLNDPNLSAYVSAPHGSWATATFLQIQSDILTALQSLRTGSQGLIEPDKDAICMTLPTDVVDYLATPTDFGYSVKGWLAQFYPNVRIASAPQLNNANGGANVFYVHAEHVRDSGTDDERTFIQVVPATFQLLGIQKLAKGYEEDYANATAGIMCKRPYAVKRFTGI